MAKRGFKDSWTYDPDQDPDTAEQRTRRGGGRVISGEQRDKSLRDIQQLKTNDYKDRQEWQDKIDKEIENQRIRDSYA
jgi:hypothetical protein